jgi:hypothetical protein
MENGATATNMGVLTQLNHTAARLLVAAESDPENADMMRALAAELQLYASGLGGTLH